MAFHTSDRYAKADYTFMMHVLESGCCFYVCEQLSLLKSIPKRACERLNEHSYPSPCYLFKPFFTSSIYRPSGYFTAD